MPITLNARAQCALTSLLLSMSAAVGWPCGVLAAESYPSKPIRFVVPYPPGGASDVIARLLSQKLTEELAQPVVVENRPGANGNIALDLVAKSAPDGYTLLMGNVGPNAINAGLYKTLPFDPAKSFSPVLLTNSMPIVLLVKTDSDIGSAAELIQFIKKNPGNTSFASGGNGSATHLTAEMFKSAAGLDSVHVPYKGDSPAMTALMSGDVTFTFATIIAAMPQIKNGRVKPIGIATEKPLESLPGVATISSSGLPNFESSSWGGVFVPAGTPSADIALLNEKLNKILAMPQTRERLEGMGAQIVGGTPEALQRYLEAEIGKWSDVIRISGARVD